MITKDPVFDKDRPNNVYSLLGTFGSLSCDFHRMDGKGYEFYADQIIKIDKTNPQIAARLTGAYNKWRSYSSERQEVMRPHMEKIKNSKPSENTFEIIGKALQEPERKKTKKEVKSKNPGTNEKSQSSTHIYMN